MRTFRPDCVLHTLECGDLGRDAAWLQSWELQDGSGDKGRDLASLLELQGRCGDQGRDPAWPQY